MDPFTLGILVACGASGAMAALGIRKRKGRDGRVEDPPGQVGPAPRASGSTVDDVFHGLRVGDVLTHLTDEFWLAGELTLMREGTAAVRLFTAPERGRERWVAMPRDGRSLWVLFVDPALAAVGWPGVEVPAEGKVMRRVEQGNVAITPAGEVSGAWEGMGRFAMFRALDGVALVLEGPQRERLALVGREVPKQLVQKMG